ncbi:MAG: hypothetical protein QOE98_1583 [Gaiellaceae bacterium]|nr:hypothetical protein [Gaiellaceae bacterium]
MRLEQAADAPADDGVTGNRRLTNSTAAVLFVLLAVEGVTLLTLGSTLPLHIFIGVALVPPVLLKVATTGYRFVRYYRGSPPYVRRGPPPVVLRLLGPLVVLSTGVLLATGVALLAIGPGDGIVRNLHTWSFIAFFVVTGVHVLAHARKVPAQAAADWRPATRLPGSASRRAVVLGSLIVGLAIGAVAVAYDGPWVHRSHDRGDTGAVTR